MTRINDLFLLFITLLLKFFEIFNFLNHWLLLSSLFFLVFSNLLIMLIYPTIWLQFRKIVWFFAFIVTFKMLLLSLIDVIICHHLFLTMYDLSILNIRHKLISLRNFLVISDFINFCCNVIILYFFDLIIIFFVVFIRFFNLLLRRILLDLTIFFHHLWIVNYLHWSLWLVWLLLVDLLILCMLFQEF